ncbi:nephrin isoform X2 [Hyalella azteca]|uniref:Nephrin isoform X2 n=1 Tax=Hyalella azteca TaxID=294128 RepID=A0A8B7NSS4_HYAAZ|nr:nephrin isoform X2 [Hyalella azteca]
MALPATARSAGVTNEFCHAHHRKRRRLHKIRVPTRLHQKSASNISGSETPSAHKLDDINEEPREQSLRPKNGLACCVQSSGQWSVMMFVLTLFLALSIQTQAENQVEQVRGSTAELPCKVPIFPNTTSLRVLWYKDNNGKASYVFKADGSLQDAEQTVDGSVWGGDRVTFQPLHSPPALFIENVVIGDEALYRCRVFIGASPYSDATRLRVLVPPDPPTILNAEGVAVNSSSVAFNEGQTADLTCQVTGGVPPPFVNWYWDQELLDGDHDTEATGVVRNRLLFGPLTRNHSNARLVCHAQTPKLIKPLNTVFWVNIRFKPTSVQIVTNETPMVVGESYPLQCQTVGALPPARLTWWLDGQQLDNSSQKIYNQISEGDNMTLSTLVLIPVIQNKHKELQCRAESPVISHAPLVDSRRLTIHYMGSVELEIRGHDVERGVVEGADVLMTCNVDADPPARLIHWYHKVGQDIRKLEGVEGAELSLSGVSRNQSGVYTCVATNSVRVGHSNTVVLQVNYKPTCRDSGLQLVGTDTYEKVKLGCRINSSPDPTSFRWQLKTGSQSIDMPERQFQVMDQLSILSYTPKTPMDYGTLYCWAKNLIGEQEMPCKFELVAAVFPSPLANCSSANNDTHTVVLECLGGSENGLPEIYVAEIYDITSDRLLRNISSSSPIFIIEELDPGSGYTIAAYSSNIRGASEKLTVHAFTQPLLKANIGILIGVGAAVILMVIVVMVIMKLKTNKSTQKSKLKCSETPILKHGDDKECSKKPLGPDEGVSRGGKQTVINFPPAPPVSSGTPDVAKKIHPAPTLPRPDAPPAEVEYAELEFVNDKKAKKKKKKAKKKKDMKDEETEYASIDHVRTRLADPEYLAQQEKHRQQNEDIKDLPPADASLQPLLKPAGAAPPSATSQANRSLDADDRGRLIMPEGALESSV